MGWSIPRDERHRDREVNGGRHRRDLAYDERSGVSGSSPSGSGEFDDDDADDTDSGVGSGTSGGYGGVGAASPVGTADDDGHRARTRGGSYGTGSGGATHSPVAAPLCEDCRNLELSFFDPSCPGCRRLLNSPYTNPGHIFAILRQWVPQVQQNIELLVDQILRCGASVNDRDGLTDMTLLHYACKAGANGVGDERAAARIVGMLLARGADPSLQCRWTEMTALHYSAYFDIPQVVKLLLDSSGDADVDTRCRTHENGTPLHIAASNLSLGTAKVLIERGADLHARDDLGRTPSECVDASSFELLPNVDNVIAKMQRLLSTDYSSRASTTLTRQSFESISGRALLKAMGLRVGDRVIVGGSKPGTLRFCGSTEFATGIWAGVELDNAEGRNDGSVNGQVYFRCEANHGIFSPMTKISKLSSLNLSRHSSLRRSQSKLKQINYGTIDTSKITSRISSSLSSTESNRAAAAGDDENGDKLAIGDRVIVIGAGRRKGTVRYCGPVNFAVGLWYGVELDKPEGRNDGSVQGERYFTCPINCGVFAPPARVQRLGPNNVAAVPVDRRESSSDPSTTSAESSLLEPSSTMSSMASSVTVGSSPSYCWSGRSGTLDAPTFSSLRRSSSVRQQRSLADSGGSPAGMSSFDNPSSSSRGVSSRNSIWGNGQQHSPSSSGTFSRSLSVRYSGNSYRDPREPVKKPSFEQPVPWQTIALEAERPARKRSKDDWLQIGTNVLYKHEVGVIKYIGGVDFADGIWLGVEMRAPRGNHDGYYEGRRYFHCKKLHGLFVRPASVTVRGICGAKLVKDPSSYPDCGQLNSHRFSTRL